MSNTKYRIPAQEIKTVSVTAAIIFIILTVLSFSNHSRAIDSCVENGHSMSYCEKVLNSESH